MRLAIARLEAWMRDYYHDVDCDIGSSGVRDLTLAELRIICGFDLVDLYSMTLHDSESHGGRRLRAALAQRWTGGDEDRVMVTHGSSEAIYIVMNTLLNPGDEVIVADPAYQQLYGIAEGLGCRVTRWLVWDHAFGEMTYNAPPLPLPDSGYRKRIVFGTLSESYGLAGLRVGWCLA